MKRISIKLFKYQLKLKFIVYCLLVCLTIYGSPSMAGPSCFNILNKILPVKAKNIQGLGDVISKKLKIQAGKLDSTQVLEVNNFLSNLSTKEVEAFMAQRKIIGAEISNLNAPYTIISSLRKANGKPHIEVLNLYKILFLENNSSVILEKVNAWVKSEEHAIFLYSQLVKIGIEKNQELLSYLVNINSYFKGSLEVQSEGVKSLITYSFEKESSSSEISLWFKDPKYSDNGWLSLSSEERLTLLKKRTNKKKKFLSEDRIAPTEFKPEYLSGYSQELVQRRYKSYMWEVSNKAYEINLDRIGEQLRDMVELTGETHSFHTHIVFHMNKKYQYFDSFVLWAKSVNDYLYLKGMEEGLHGTELTGLASLPGHNFPNSSLLPSKLGEISLQSHKFFSMGLRSEIYGKSDIENNVKLGLELRDVSRSVGTTENFLLDISGSVSNYKWEAINADKVEVESIGFLKNDKKLVEKELADKFDPAFVKLLDKIKSNVSLALLPYDQMLYLNYTTGKVESLDENSSVRIRQAKNNFLINLKKIEREFLVDEAKGWNKEYSLDDYKPAVQHDLTLWAQEAQVSELFKNF